MGQYWVPVNLDKREFVDPHNLGTGLKLWEQIANHPGTGAALLILMAAMPERRGGGDLQPHPIIGHWAGDRIAVVGDYAEDEDLNAEHKAKSIWEECFGEVPTYRDVSLDVCMVIACELGGEFKGEGWRNFETEGA